MMRHLLVYEQLDTITKELFGLESFFYLYWSKSQISMGKNCDLPQEDIMERMPRDLVKQFAPLGARIIDHNKDFNGEIWWKFAVEGGDVQLSDLAALIPTEPKYGYERSYSAGPPIFISRDMANANVIDKSLQFVCQWSYMLEGFHMGQNPYTS